MTLLLITNQLDLGGAERVALDHARLLRRLGERVVLAASPGDLQDEDPNLGVAALPPPGGQHLVRAVRRVHRMRRALGVRAIIAHSLRAVFLARLAGQPRASTFAVAHGWPPARLATAAASLRLAGRVFAVSAELRDALIEHGLDADRVTWLPNVPPHHPKQPSCGGADALRKSLGADERRPVCLAVGRLEPQKAPERFLSIARRCPDTHFWWAGDGSLSAVLREGPLPGNVRLLGRRDDVPSLLAASDIYLCCSRWEGHSLAMLEAMRAGLPVVSTRVHGLYPLLDPFPTLVHAQADLDGLAGAVRALSLLPALRRQIGETHQRDLDALIAQHDPAGTLLAAVGPTAALRRCP